MISTVSALYYVLICTQSHGLKCTHELLQFKPPSSACENLKTVLLRAIFSLPNEGFYWLNTQNRVKSLILNINNSTRNNLI